MYCVTGLLYKNKKMLLRGMHEDLEDFVEELNPKFVDRREFKIYFLDGTICKNWRRR